MCYLSVECCQGKSHLNVRFDHLIECYDSLNVLRKCFLIPNEKEYCFGIKTPDYYLSLFIVNGNRMLVSFFTWNLLPKNKILSLQFTNKLKIVLE